jgi:hypothetical protein
MPSRALRSAAWSSSGAEIPSAALRPWVKAKMGSAGSLVTGARTDSSAVSETAKPPVRHIPMSPTPGPPQRLWTSRQRARSQSVIGLERFCAKIANSRLTQARSIWPAI